MPFIHESAAQGYSREAGTYARGRPDYPDALLTWLTDVLGVAPGMPVLDVAAGTGKFTALLARTQAEVTAVEPVDGMREALVGILPDVIALPGTAESIPLADACVQVVTCAQAFHWFANIDAVREMHRVLQPGGRLGLIWNVRDNQVDWVAELSAIMAPYETGTPRHHLGRWQDALTAERLFHLPPTVSFRHFHEGPPETVIVDRTLSVSFIAALPEPEKAVVAARVRDLVQKHPALRGQATVRYPYRTDAYACLRIGPSPANR